jgi:sec-independent protein translocase protein TatA
MGSLSIWHWLVVIVVVLLIFGRGKISELMGDVAQGIKAFKKGMSDDEKAEAEVKKPEAVKTIDHQPAPDATNAGTAMKARSDTEKRFEGGTV